jgi:hypothetical protein
MLPAPRAQKLGLQINVELVGSQEVFGRQRAVTQEGLGGEDIQCYTPSTLWRRYVIIHRPDRNARGYARWGAPESYAPP